MDEHRIDLAPHQNSFRRHHAMRGFLCPVLAALAQRRIRLSNSSEAAAAGGLVVCFAAAAVVEGLVVAFAVALGAGGLTTVESTPDVVRGGPEFVTGEADGDGGASRVAADGIGVGRTVLGAADFGGVVGAEGSIGNAEPLLANEVGGLEFADISTPKVDSAPAVIRKKITAAAKRHRRGSAAGSSGFLMGISAAVAASADLARGASGAGELGSRATTRIRAADSGSALGSLDSGVVCSVSAASGR